MESAEGNIRKEMGHSKSPLARSEPVTSSPLHGYISRPPGNLARQHFCAGSGQKRNVFRSRFHVSTHGSFPPLRAELKPFASMFVCAPERCVCLSPSLPIDRRGEHLDVRLLLILPSPLFSSPLFHPSPLLYSSPLL